MGSSLGWRLSFDKGQAVALDTEALEGRVRHIEVYLFAVLADMADCVDNFGLAGLNLVTNSRWLRIGCWFARLGHDSASVTLRQRAYQSFCFAECGLI